MKVDVLSRAFRGGSWRSVALFARFAYRNRHEPGYRNSVLGFRLVFSRENEEEAT